MVKMSIEAEGWHMDAGPPSWDPEAKTFSFFLHKRDCESVLCFVAMDALENAVQSTLRFNNWKLRLSAPASFNRRLPSARDFSMPGQ